MSTVRGDGSRCAAWIGLMVLAVALLLFVSLTPRFPFPGPWLDALTAYKGLHPFRPLSHPLWGMIMSQLARVPGCDVAVLANMFSAVCGCVTVWLVYRIVAGLGFHHSSASSRYVAPDAATASSRMLAGVVAAAYAGLCTPLLVAFTRANPLSLDLLLLVSALFFSIRFRQTSRMVWWYGFALLYGAGCAEFSTFTLAAPAFGVAWLWMLWRAGQLSATRLVASAALFFAGFSVFLLACWQYYQSPAAAWREFSTFGQVAKYFALDQYHALRYGVPKYGWLSIMLLMILPGFVVFRSGLDDDEDFYTRLGKGLFRVMLFLVAFVSLFDLPGTPWRINGASRLVVTPYVITAMWFGHLVGLLYHRAANPGPSRRWWMNAIRGGRRPVLILITAGALALAGARHVSFVHPGHVRPAVDFADRLLDGLDGRAYLLSDGMLDSVLALRAEARPQPLVLLNIRVGRAAPYLKYVASRIDRPDLRSMATSGLQPMLDVWMKSDTNVAEQLAVLDYPDAWRLRGWDYVPRRGMFFGAPLGQTTDAHAVFDDGRAYLHSWTQSLVSSRSPGLGSGYVVWTARQMSLFANNLGVFAENAGLHAEAREAYLLARTFNSNNFSALLNLNALAQRDGHPDREQIGAELEKTLARRGAAVGLLNQVLENGYVNSPAAYSQEGLALAMSGRPEYGAQKLSQALETTATNAAAERLRADLLDPDSASELSAQAYRDALVRDPGNISVLGRLARHEMARGNVAEAESLLARLAETDISPAALAIEKAILFMARGQMKESRDELEFAARQKDCPPLVWITLGAVAVQIQDADLLARVTEKLSGMPRFVPGLIFQADLAVSKGDIAAARLLYEQAHAAEPRHRVALEKLLASCLYGRDMTEAGRLSDELLNLDANNFMANYVNSVLFFRDGKKDLAEAALRRSVATRSYGPALNDLAWLLQDQGHADEALPFSQQAVTLMPSEGLFWGTQGLILSKLKKRMQAADAFDQGLKHGLQHPESLIVAAIVFFDVQRPDDARRALEIAGRHADKLEPSQKKAFDRLWAQVAEKPLSAAPPDVQY